MILLAIFFGLTAGTIINWAGDYLVRFSRQRDELEGKQGVRIKSALWLGLTSPAFRSYLYKKDTDAWLQVFVEIFLATLFAFLWQRLGFTFPFIFLVMICSFLVLVSLIDVKYRLVPNVLVLPAMAILLVFQAVPLSVSTWYALLGGGAAFFLFLLASLAAPGRLGGGDIKLAAFLGLLFGFPYVFWALMVGVLAGGVTAVYLFTTKHWQPQTSFPYAPFLCLGAMVALFYDPIPWLLTW